jgi:catechol 2,3-dioxygenase-like lactoylglutathione lyase family enzyme
VAQLPTSLGAITLFVDDISRAKSFYQAVFQLSPVYEDENSAAFQFENTIVNLLARPAAHELVSPNAVADGGGGASFQLTIWVEDTDSLVHDLRSRGVELLNGPIDRPWGLRTAAFSDPDGHIWEIAQGLGESA